MHMTGKCFVFGAVTNEYVGHGLWPKGRFQLPTQAKEPDGQK